MKAISLKLIVLVLLSISIESIAQVPEGTLVGQTTHDQVNGKDTIHRKRIWTFKPSVTQPGSLFFFIIEDTTSADPNSDYKETIMYTGMCIEAKAPEGARRFNVVMDDPVLDDPKFPPGKRVVLTLWENKGLIYGVEIKGDNKRLYRYEME